MPLTTVHLVALSPGKSPSDFIRAIRSRNVKPIVISRAVRWIIRPEKLSTTQLLDTKWDLFIVLPFTEPLPEAYLSKDWVQNHWTITAGVPGNLLKDFDKKNDRLLHPQKGDVPALTGALDQPRRSDSSQGLEFSDELDEWSKSFKLGQEGAVSMFNLLAFKPGKEMHESYLRYGQAFAESIGSRRGGKAKIVGKVVPKQGTPDEDTAGWDEVALAHYPSINHFLDMLASEDYQKVNHADRLPSLRDTCILCTVETDPELGTDKAKL